jgi:hypothetical protein
MDEDHIIGAGIARCIQLDRNNAIEPKLREDYGEGKLDLSCLQYFYVFLVVNSLES